MAEDAYYYKPAGCDSKTCKLHVFIHGCGGSADLVGTGEATATGLLEIADAYDLILLLPQTSGKGPNQGDRGSCWNIGWYRLNAEAAADTYLTYGNLQAMTIKAMVDDMMTGQATTVASTSTTQAPTTTSTTTTITTTTTTTTTAAPTTAAFQCCVAEPCPGDTDACWENYETKCNGFHDEIYPACQNGRK